MTPYERVQQSRQRTAATFPLPSPVDCIRYAVTEIAEYDDALLRQERAGDKRNNAKDHDPRTELGQALYMLLSAAVQWQGRLYCAEIDLYPLEGRVALYGYTLRELTYLLTNNGESYTFVAAYSGMCELAARHSWDVDALIDDTCAAFEAKHAAVLA